MRNELQVRVRAYLFIVGTTGFIAAGLAVAIAPYLKLENYVRNSTKYGIFVATEPVGPPWLRSLPLVAKFFVKPIQVQVLAQPLSRDEIQILGERMSYRSAKGKLMEFRDNMQARTGLNNFSIVADFSRWPDHPSEAGDQLFDFAWALGSHSTPCGLSDFR
jgi:hypothetical protein